MTADPPEPVRTLVNRQAEDDGLWFIAKTAPEAYLQSELRRLHAAIEDASRLTSADHDKAEVDYLRGVRDGLFAATRWHELRAAATSSVRAAHFHMTCAEGLRDDLLDSARVAFNNATRPPSPAQEADHDR